MKSMVNSQIFARMRVMQRSLIVTDISLVSSAAMAVARPLADRIAAGETTQRTQQFLSAVEEAV
jgi:hypothetical protein